MADIKLLLQNYGSQDDDQDDEDYSKYYETTMLEQTNPDDLLTPLEKLRKYCTSENIYTRQIVARSIVETVQSITNKQECLSLLEIITKLSDDIEPSVRCELMEQLPPCCMMIMDMRLVPDAVSVFILPVMVKYLTDPNNQVRKLSQNALLQLMDQDLIHRDDVESQICPVLIQLTEPESGDDFRTEAVALMTKITPLIGGDVTEKLFLNRFGELCADPLFHVRKVCASNFGDMACVIRRETTEVQLLPLFARLCEDGVWGVRKACAETFMSVSGTCSRDVRYESLAPLFVGLLCDKSRWVQMAAYQALGQFIATFADPLRTGFDVNEDGNLIRCQTDPNNATADLYGGTFNVSDLQTRGDTSAETANLSHDNSNSRHEQAQTADGSQTFNNFEFWRTPLPQVDIPDDEPPDRLQTTDSHLIEQTSDSSNVNSNTDTETNCTQTESQKGTPDESTSQETNQDNTKENLDNISNNTNDNTDNQNKDDDDDDDDDDDEPMETDENDRSVSPQSSGIHHGNDSIFEINPTSDNDSDDDDHSHSHHNTSAYASSLVDEESLHSQKIVPPALLEHYISMTEPSKAQTIDGELPRHCAFSLPGVVLALGRDNWHLLKETYDLLSTDMQWKVRRTLAFSIHDLAMLLGQDICVSDLVPIFNGFLKDLDEVRIGVLKHLYDFIQILPSDLQHDYLSIFSEFLKTDNMRNWRFRQDLSHQLMSLVHLYDAEDLAEYFCPVSLELVSDKVAEVREYSFHLLCILMQKLCQHNNSSLIHKFSTNIITLATHHQHWVKRKACAQIYQRFLEGNWYDAVSFSKDFLPSLVNLCTDVVPNIRIIAAKALIAFIRTEHFLSLKEEDERRTIVNRTLEALQSDDDRDVRYFSGGKVEERCSTLTFTEEHFSDGSVRIIQRGIQGYTLADDVEDDDEDDDDDDDVELVTEVYIDEQPVGEDQVIVEEYYVEENENDISTHNNMVTTTTTSSTIEQQQGEEDDDDVSQIYVEEIVVEEVVEQRKV